MRFLGIGEWNNLGDMYLRLAAGGHGVRVFIEEPEAQDILLGMIERVRDWRPHLDWIRSAGPEGFILFESASKGPLQDRLRREGYQVIGGSAYGDRLENDRPFGQEVLRQAGMRTAPVHAFRDFAAAKAFLRARPGRFVFKNNGGKTSSTDNYVGELDDASDMLSFLSLQEARRGREPPDFILMEYLAGVEVGVGAYFDGRRFLKPALLDWEHKRFFPGDLGELTGEMGTVVTYRGAERLFDLSLGRMESRLREEGHCGYINLNTIVNAQGIWPLEFTCRFGYPGFAICDALHMEGWDAIFRKMAGTAGGSGDILTREGFAVGVVVTVPPFPYEYGYAQLSKGMPISFHPDFTDADRDGLHFGEVGMADGQLATAGALGYVLVVTAAGVTVAAAREAAYARVRKVIVPNRRYRIDIGEKLIAEDWDALVRLGYLP